MNPVHKYPNSSTSVLILPSRVILCFPNGLLLDFWLKFCIVCATWPAHLRLATIMMMIIITTTTNATACYCSPLKTFRRYEGVSCVLMKISESLLSVLTSLCNANVHIFTYLLNIHKTVSKYDMKISILLGTKLTASVPIHLWTLQYITHAHARTHTHTHTHTVKYIKDWTTICHHVSLLLLPLASK
jgi:hypothetical protein